MAFSFVLSILAVTVNIIAPPIRLYIILNIVLFIVLKVKERNNWKTTSSWGAGNSWKLKELPHPSPRYACDIFQKYQILKIVEGAREKRFLIVFEMTEWFN